MKSVVYDLAAAKALKRHANRAEAIRAKVKQYAVDPNSLTNNVKALQGVDAKRLRVGDFRVIFTETDTTITVLDISRAGHLRLRGRAMTAIMTKTPAGEDIVILSRAEYEDLLAAREDAEDVAIAKVALERLKSGGEPVISEEDMDAFLAAPSPLAFWRKKRGLTQAGLSAASGVAQGYISEIESGKKTGDFGSLGKIAKALGLRFEDMIAR